MSGFYEGDLVIYYDKQIEGRFNHDSQESNFDRNNQKNHKESTEED